MSEELSKSQQILMWELFAAGGAKLLKDIIPKPKGTPHHQLAKKGFLKTTGYDRSILIELEDKGWRWIAESDPFPIEEQEKRVTAERRLLQTLMHGIKKYASKENKTIQDSSKPHPIYQPCDSRNRRLRRLSNRADPRERRTVTSRNR